MLYALRMMQEYESVCYVTAVTMHVRSYFDV